MRRPHFTGADGRSTGVHRSSSALAAAQLSSSVRRSWSTQLGQSDHTTPVAPVTWRARYPRPRASDRKPGEYADER